MLDSMPSTALSQVTVGSDAISAAAVGVGARTSATKSAMVKSASCPTPLTMGTGLRAITGLIVRR